MDTSIVDAGFPITEAAPSKAKKAKVSKPKAAKKAAKPKAKKPAPKKTAKPKAKKPAKRKPAKVVKKAKAKAGVIVRTERLDMRLSKAEKVKLLAKAKKLRRTVTSIMLEAIEKVKA
jgi:hypothetical protein